MSTLDRYIAAVQAAKNKAENAAATLDALDASSEAVTGVGETVGSERHIEGGQAMTDSTETARAGMQRMMDQADELIAHAESLKTAGGGDAPAPSTTANTGSQPTAPAEPVATTGADPKPNPVHATPAHTREPSRKIGDPVKPVEMEVPDRSRASRFRQLGRKSTEGTEELKEYGEELTAVYDGAVLDTYDPLGQDLRTETQTAPSMPQIQGPQAQEHGATDLVGTAVVMTAASVDALSRLWDKRKQKRAKRSEGGNNG